MKKTNSVVALLSCAFLIGSLHGQVSITSENPTYEQDFQSLVINQLQTPWVDNSTLPGWTVTSSNAVANGNYRAGFAGTSSSATLGDSSSGDFIKSLQINGPSGLDGDTRFGNRTGSAPGNVFFTLELINNTGSEVSEFSLGYEAAQFLARGENGLLEVSYSFNNVDFTTIDGSGGLGGTSSMSYTPLGSPSSNLILNYAQINESIESFSSTISGASWGDSTSLYIQFAFWRDVPGGSTGNSPVLSIDDVTFAIPESNAFSLAGGILCVVLVGVRRLRNRA